MFHYTTNLASSVRTEIFHDKEHLVVPLVMIVEGVLNGAFVPAEEFGKFPDSWNGRPVPVLHPEENGRPVSANRPDIIQRNTIGSIFNTHVEDKKLKAEAWLDVEKARRLGHGSVIDVLSQGAVMEISTGYFAEAVEFVGVYNGKEHKFKHMNIVPDHLALLPSEIGACSIEDGCGTRANSKKEMFAMKVNEAWAALGKALGLNVNCECEENNMDILKQAGDLVKTNAITPAQFKMLQEMSPEDRTMLQAIISALGEVGEEEVEMEEVEDEEMAGMGDEYAKNMSKGKAKASSKSGDTVTMTQEQIDKMVANSVKDHLRRTDIVGKLVANDRNTLTEEQMATMSVDQLEAIEKMIRPVDFSGAGGFATNGGKDDNITPMPLRGVLSKKKEA